MDSEIGKAEPPVLSYDSHGKEVNPRAMGSFLSGVLALFTCVTFMPSVLLGVMAIAAGMSSLRQIRGNPMQYGRVLALSGIVLGAMGVVLGGMMGLEMFLRR